ncbi:hypothetical protein [Pseudomonas sp. AN-1]|uniref:hypothetical protein n=1 Tax=Pseudomonas sp. AN-1 TaxID=3096605 RepID=UPI002A6AE164|nr:hypothetical protein [Pseudomonas sp. AN-1]WPP45346.1 hypothetical protein SK095_19215 [Pseudomonas sp. AN-1]
MPLVVLAVLLSLYGSVLGFAYVWDDIDLFVSSPLLRGAGDWWTAVSQPVLPATTYFRPAVLSSFWFEFGALGVDPFYSHLVNLLLFLFNVCMAGWLAAAVCGCAGSRCWIMSAVVMLLYGLHPALVESTAWVAGRFDLMVTSFVLLGLNIALRWQGWPGALGAATAFAFACLSKEMAATFPILLCGLLWTRQAPTGSVWDGLRLLVSPSTLRLLGMILLAGAAYLALRYQVHSGLVHLERKAAVSLDWVGHVGYVGQALIFYGKMLVWPFPFLGPLHPLDVTGLTAADIRDGWLAVAGVSLGLVWVLWRGGRAAILLVLSVVALLPVLQILPLTIGGNIGHERFMALPLVFFVMACAHWLFGLYGVLRQRVAKAVLCGSIALLCLYSGLNLKIYLPVWQSDLALWSWAHGQHPDFEYAQSLYVLSALNAGRLDLARQELFAVAEQDAPEDFLVMKGYLHVLEGNSREAIEAIEKALSQLYRMRDEMLAQGIDVSEVSLDNKRAPNLWILRISYSLLAEAHLQLGDYEKVLENVEIFRFYEKNFSVSYLLEALARYGRGEVALGDAAFEKAVQLSADAGERSISVRSSFVRRLCESGKAAEQLCLAGY